MSGLIFAVQTQKVNYMNLPSPVRYEDSQREAISKSSSSYENFTLVSRPWSAVDVRQFTSCQKGSKHRFPSSQVFKQAVGTLLQALLLLLCAVALKPDVFEGLRFELTRPLNQNFFLTHRWV
jgi:hypothetical protein